MPLVTAEQLRKRLDWGDVREEAMPEYLMRVFRVVPADESQPSIAFLFDADVSRLQQLGSGIWHCHPDEIDDAIEMARKLVHHELCIVEERNKAGEYSSSGPLGPDEIPKTMRLDADYLVRRFFGKAEVREAIDFTRYVKEKHLYIERSWKTHTDAVWESLGQSKPEF